MNEYQTSVPEALQQARVIASVDTLSIFSRHMRGKLQIRGKPAEYLRKLTGQPVRHDRNRFGSTFRLTRPHRKLSEIAAWLESKQTSISRLDIAFDFQFADSDELGAASAYLRDHLWIRNGALGMRRYDWCDHGSPNGNFNLVDWGSPSRGKSQGKEASRDAQVYRRAHNVLRIELRLYGADSVKRYVRTLDEVLALDPTKIFERVFCLRYLKPRAVERWAKREVARNGCRFKPLTGIWPRLLRYRPDSIKEHTMVRPFKLGQRARWVEEPKATDTSYFYKYTTTTFSH